MGAEDETDTPSTVPPVDATLVSRVAVKIPPFWPDQPVHWFRTIEAQFHLAGITASTTKYYHIIGHITGPLARTLDDVLSAPLGLTPYETLKAAVIERTAATEKERLHQLLHEVVLGDQKPSQLLRHMRSLVGSPQISDKIMRQLFLERLPQPVQLALAVIPDTQSPELLATTADSVVAALRSVSSLAPVMHQPTAGALPHMPAAAYLPVSEQPPTLATLVQLQAEQLRQMREQADHTAQLQLQVNRLTAQLAGSHIADRPRSRGRSRSLARNRSFSRNREGGMCWYHSNFGAKARKCEAPCTYTEQAPRSLENY